MLSSGFLGGGSNGSEHPPLEGFAPRKDPLARTLDVLAERLEPGATESGGVFFRADAIPLEGVAELASLEPTGEPGAMFVGVASRHFEPQGFFDLFDSEAQVPWRLLVRWMAELAGHHVASSPLGQALAEAGVSETEVRALVDRRGADLHRGLWEQLGILRDAHRTLDFFDVARLLLTDSDEEERLSVWSEILDVYREHRP